MEWKDVGFVTFSFVKFIHVACQNFCLPFRWGDVMPSHLLSVVHTLSPISPIRTWAQVSLPRQYFVGPLNSDLKHKFMGMGSSRTRTSKPMLSPTSQFPPPQVPAAVETAPEVNSQKSCPCSLPSTRPTLTRRLSFWNSAVNEAVPCLLRTDADPSAILVFLTHSFSVV